MKMKRKRNGMNYSGVETYVQDQRALPMLTYQQTVSKHVEKTIAGYMHLLYWFYHTS